MAPSGPLVEKATQLITMPSISASRARHHAMTEMSSHTQLQHTTDSQKNAPKKAYNYAGKENKGTRKYPKYDQENSVTKKDPKDEESSVNKRDQNSPSSWPLKHSLLAIPTTYDLSYPFLFLCVSRVAKCIDMQAMLCITSPTILGKNVLILFVGNHLKHL